MMLSPWVWIEPGNIMGYHSCNELLISWLGINQMEISLGGFDLVKRAFKRGWSFREMMLLAWKESKPPCCEHGDHMARNFRWPLGGESSFWSATSNERGVSVILLQGNELCPQAVSSEEDSQTQTRITASTNTWSQPGETLSRGPS